MILYQTISQLDVGTVSAPIAREMGQLGYMQWLGALPPMMCYAQAARCAKAEAQPFAENSPAIAVFCDLLEQSLARPLHPLPLQLPERVRKGGAQARRERIAPQTVARPSEG